MVKLRLYFRGLLTLSSLWGMVFALIIGINLIIMFFGDPEMAPMALLTWVPVLLALGIVFFQFLIGPFIMDLMLRFVYNMTWIEVEQLPPHLKQFVEQKSQEHGISIKKIGMIHDQNPEAFTYGHFKKNARIVLSDGILTLLNPDEQIAVVAHEMGHIANRDFLFMTMASAVPILFYVIYSSSRGIMRFSRFTSSSSSKGKDNSAAIIVATMLMIMVVSYIFYFISQFVVLFLSRVREYYADNFSGKNTGKPASLANALVKIAYGLVRTESHYSEQIENDKVDSRTRVSMNRRRGFSHAIRSLNISEVGTSKGFVQTAYGTSDMTAQQTVQKQAPSINPEIVAKAGAWDLESPWATVIELQSTHPLIAKRILALEDQAEDMNQQRSFPGLGTIQIKGDLWGKFFVDLFLNYFAPTLLIAIPVISVIVSLIVGYHFLLGLGIGLILSGLLWVWRIYVRFPKVKDPKLITVEGAITDITAKGFAGASPIRGKPIKLQGMIIGRGQAGYYLSGDTVIRDRTGIMRLLYNPIIGLLRLFAALTKVDKLIGSQATAIGWYRRANSPYVEIKRIESIEGRKMRSFRDTLNWVLVWVLFGVGLICIIRVAGIALGF